MFINKRPMSVYGTYENTAGGYALAKKQYMSLVAKFGARHVVLATSKDQILVGILGDIIY